MPSAVKVIKDTRERQQHEHWESCKATLRAKVEYLFRMIRRQFIPTKVRYRGLVKDSAQVLTLLRFPTFARPIGRFCRRGDKSVCGYPTAPSQFRFQEDLLLR
jgi:IS5 family transposase